jgi:ubiquinone/menaquinone biosynthesis C-methylase UbiE
MNAERSAQGAVLELPEPTGDPKFNTAHHGLTELWDELQRLQVDFAIEQEVAAYHRNPAWPETRTVLDVGTGNGYYLRRLAARFPGKRYCGIDTSKELIAIAERGPATDGVEFHCREISAESASYDCVIMRLLLQHLADPDAMLGSAARVTARGGCAVVIDCWDAARRLEPDLPEFRRFFAAYTRQQAGTGLRRDVVDRLPEIVAARSDWRVAGHLRPIVPSTRPGNLECFRRIYGSFIDLIAISGTLTYDFERLRAEWNHWCRLPDAYAQVGLNIVTLERT